MPEIYFTNCPGHTIEDRYGDKYKMEGVWRDCKGIYFVHVCKKGERMWKKFHPKGYHRGLLIYIEDGVVHIIHGHKPTPTKSKIGGTCRICHKGDSIGNWNEGWECEWVPTLPKFIQLLDDM